jgi:hypothetical protein
MPGVHELVQERRDRYLGWLTEVDYTVEYLRLFAELDA